MKSKFTGGLLGDIGISLLCTLITLITLGLGLPWAICIRERWYAKHTIIDGDGLVFDGKGIQLFALHLVAFLLFIIPVAVFILFCILYLKLDFKQLFLNIEDLLANFKVLLSDSKVLLLLILVVWAASIPWLLYVLYLPIRIQRWSVKHTHKQKDTCDNNRGYDYYRGYGNYRGSVVGYRSYDNNRGYDNYRRYD